MSIGGPASTPSARERLKTGLGVFLVATLATCGLVYGANPINGAAYLMGFGDDVTMTVTETSSGGKYTRGSRPGQGHYERDGEQVPLQAYDVRQGELVQGRLPVMPVGEPILYLSASEALLDLSLGSLPIWLLLLLGVVVLIRRRRRRAVAEPPDRR